METPVIISVTSLEGRLTFHRAIPRIDGGSIAFDTAPPIHIHLDPSKEPAYSRHPDGGWISPPYERFTDMSSQGIECDFIDHIRCSCHKRASDSDESSLEKYGHTETCSRMVLRHTPIPSIAPRAGIDPSLLGDGAPQAIGPRPGGTPAHELERMLNAGYLPGQQPITPPRPEPIPAGGLPLDILEGLMGALGGATMGEGGGMPISVALRDLKMDETKYSPQVISGQLWTNFRFSPCQRCGAWGNFGNSRSCGACG